jgi:hypothetical protein
VVQRAVHIALIIGGDGHVVTQFAPQEAACRSLGRGKDRFPQMFRFTQLRDPLDRII